MPTDDSSGEGFAKRVLNGKQEQEEGGVTRRDMLKALGATTVGVTAGCLGGNSNKENTDVSSTEQGTTQTSTSENTDRTQGDEGYPVDPEPMDNYEFMEYVPAVGELYNKDAVYPDCDTCRGPAIPLDVVYRDNEKILEDVSDPFEEKWKDDAAIGAVPLIKAKESRDAAGSGSLGVANTKLTEDQLEERLSDEGYEKQGEVDGNPFYTGDFTLNENNVPLAAVVEDNRLIHMHAGSMNVTREEAAEKIMGAKNRDVRTYVDRHPRMGPIMEEITPQDTFGTFLEAPFTKEEAVTGDYREKSALRNFYFVKDGEVVDVKEVEGVLRAQGY
ncbi:MAG: hypothetical protein ABEJ95_03935 [Candidatus Nanohalobium sp.]